MAIQGQEAESLINQVQIFKFLRCDLKGIALQYKYAKSAFKSLLVYHIFLASSDFVKSYFTIPTISKRYYKTAWKFHLLVLSPVCVKCLSDVRHTHHFTLSESCWWGQTFFSICLVESLRLRCKGCFLKKRQNSNWCSLIKRMLATMRQDKVPSDWSRPERF